jgi:hypothetical protein
MAINQIRGNKKCFFFINWNLNFRLILLLIIGSCVFLAILIISVGVCLYKRLGGAQYGSGQIRIISEDGSAEEELLYIFGNNGKGFGSF